MVFYFTVIDFFISLIIYVFESARFPVVIVFVNFM